MCVSVSTNVFVGGSVCVPVSLLNVYMLLNPSVDNRAIPGYALTQTQINTNAHTQAATNPPTCVRGMNFEASATSMLSAHTDTDSNPKYRKRYNGNDLTISDAVPTKAPLSPECVLELFESEDSEFL